MVSALLRRITVPAVVVALIALAGLSLNRVYNGQLLLELIAGAAAGSVLVSSALRRAPAWLVAPVSVAALAGYSLFAVATSARAGGVAGDLRTLALDAARNAVPRLLTALIPVEPQPDTVLGPLVLAWLAGFAGAELAGRNRRPALALLPPTLLYAGALVLVGPNAGVVVWQPLAFAALAALALVAGSAASGARSLPGLGSRERARLRVRTATGLAAGLAAVLAVVAVTAPLVARTVRGSPTDPRRYVNPPNLDVLDQNPLIRLSGWAANPDQRLFDVTVVRAAARPVPTTTAPSPTVEGQVSAEPVDEAPAGGGLPADVGAYDTRLRLAVLPDWDGVTWHMNADYRSAGRVLPAVARPPGADPPAEDAPAPLTIAEQITIGELQGRLLPAIPAPSRVDGIRVAYDQTTGTLLRTDPLTSGVTYTVTSVNRSIDVNLLPASDVPSGSAVARYLAVGDAVPPDLGQLAQQIGTGESSPYLKALALESFLKDHYRFAGDAASGHSYPNLRFFLFDDPRAGGQRGTSEQFAAAYAALGRLMGLPTRVVVGFRTPAGGGTVTAGDAQAWPEVLFTGVGWVAFDPLPDPAVPPRPLEDEFLPKPLPPTSPPSSVEPPDGPTYTAPPPTLAAAPPERRGPGAGLIAATVGGGILLAVVLFLAIVALTRAVRRRGRLRRGSPRERILGAWDEVLDALLLAGAPPPGHYAVHEVAAHAATVADTGAARHVRRPRPAAPPLDELAGKVNAAGFAGPAFAPVPAPPGPDLDPTLPAPDDLVAYGATVQALAYARALRARRPWLRRLLWTFDPRPLRRRRP